MELSSCLLGICLGTLILAAAGGPPAGSDLYQVDPALLAAAWEKEHISPGDPSALRHAALRRELEALAARFPSIVRLEPAGRSVEGREILLLSLGSGGEKILLWSQMHGDEPTATAALLDLIQYLGSHAQESWISGILRRYTLLCIPMLNPDGAERGQRRNAQGIDINRDARVLQTPEGRILKAVRDRHNPILGFNLHNQNSLTTVGETGKVATVALLAVAAEVPAAVVPAEAREKSALLAKKVASVLYEALSPFVYGHISRYDEAFNPRAFGDNLSIWGTPVVLVESGGIPAGRPGSLGVQLNFVGLLAALDSLASGRVERANPAVFDALLMNSETPIFDLILKNAWICTGTGVPLFQGDIAVRRDLRAGTEGEAVIADLGDLGVFSAHETVDCSGMLATPGLIAWDPGRSVFAGDGDEEYVRRGVLTVLENLEWKDMARWNAGGGTRGKAARRINWSYLVTGAPASPAADELLALARSLSAGGRGWVLPKAAGAAWSEVPALFGVETIAEEAAVGYRLPDRIEGEPAQTIRRWTSEPARRFRLGRRGTLGVGAAADLVLWKTESGAAPADLRECTPYLSIVNGRIASSAEKPVGRFIGR